MPTFFHLRLASQIHVMIIYTGVPDFATHIVVEAKWPQFCRRHFQIHCLVWNSCMSFKCHWSNSALRQILGNNEQNVCTHDDVIKWIFRVTGHLCGEFIGTRWIPHTKASDAELWCFLWSAWINGWVNNREAGDLRRYRAHYNVIVMADHM